MSANNKQGWEVVGAKKPKKPAVKTLQAKIPGAVPVSAKPVEFTRENQNLFDLFVADEQKKTKVVPPPKVVNIDKGDFYGKQNGNGKAATQKKPKAKVAVEAAKPKPVAHGFDDVARKLKATEIDHMIKTSKTHFPESSSIWLKDMASFLSHSLPFEPEDPTFSTKPLDYPLKALNQDVRNKLNALLECCTLPTIQLFQDHCLDTLVKNTTNFQLPTMGYRIMLQLVGREYPKASLGNVQRFIDTRSTIKNRHPVCLSILWSAIQSGMTDFRAGMELWYEVLFPLIGVKTYTKFVIDSLDNLLTTHSKTLAKAKEPQISVKEFFPIFDFIFCSHGLSNNQQVQLKSIYPRLKDLLFRKVGGDGHLNGLFPSFLIRLNGLISDDYALELKSCLVECLSRDLQSFSVWRDLYGGNFMQSGYLLAHVSETLNKNLTTRKARQALRESLEAFKVKNAELLVARNKPTGFDRCVEHCEIISRKMSSSKFPWKTFFVLVVGLLASAIIYDVQLHGTFKKSITGRVLKDYGVLAVWNQSVVKFNFYFAQASKWVGKNGPIYYDIVDKAVGPYVRLFWEKVLIVGQLAWDSSSPLRQWANRTLPPILEQANNYVPKLLEFAQQLANAAQSALADLGLWLQNNVFTGSFAFENIQKLLIDYTSKVQQVALEAYGWVAKQLPA